MSVPVRCWRSAAQVALQAEQFPSSIFAWSVPARIYAVTAPAVTETGQCSFRRPNTGGKRGIELVLSRLEGPVKWVQSSQSLISTMYYPGVESAFDIGSHEKAM